MTEIKNEIPAHEKKHVVFYSGGLGSFATALRVIKKYGTEKLYLLFTDTLIESNDLYRFVIETAGHFYNIDKDKIKELKQKAILLPELYESEEGRKKQLEELRVEVNELIPQLIWLSDGINPWDIFFKQKFLGNSRIAQCSHILKQEMSRKYVTEEFSHEDTVLYLGIDWTEEHRTKAPRKNWSPYPVEFPMCEEPLANKIDVVKELEHLGIEVPILYKQDFAHNNCYQGDTKFITDKGTFTFKEKVGENVRVLGINDEWQDATINSFGVQNLWNLYLKRGNEEKMFEVTPEHRWIRKNTKNNELEREVYTKDLNVGDIIPSRYTKDEASPNTENWVVTKLEPTDKYEEVFCATVPNGEEFTLEGNIRTMNCGGFCVRAGQGHFANLLEKNPKLFLYHEQKEQEIRDLIGKDVSIMRKQKNKVRFNYTLKDLREDWERDNKQEIDMDDIGGCGCFVNYDDETPEGKLYLESIEKEKERQKAQKAQKAEKDK